MPSSPRTSPWARPSGTGFRPSRRERGDASGLTREPCSNRAAGETHRQWAHCTTRERWPRARLKKEWDIVARPARRHDISRDPRWVLLVIVTRLASIIVAL